MSALQFSGGRNIAMKVPAYEYDAAVRFYRDVLGLEQDESKLPDICFAFGANQLWIDRMPGLSQAELWLEIKTDDGAGAAEHFARSGVVRCDEIEPLPEGSDGYWISAPGNMIHLVSPG